uniref:CSON009153 protein n=1 Tax=Culicoides sonorensis TaxID=179676 RepID=A0A336K2A0_CULSO
MTYLLISGNLLVFPMKSKYLYFFTQSPIILTFMLRLLAIYTLVLGSIILDNLIKVRETFYRNPLIIGRCRHQHLFIVHDERLYFEVEFFKAAFLAQRSAHSDVGPQTSPPVSGFLNINKH